MKQVCQVHGCGETVMSRGWCRRHYHQMWKHGHITLVHRREGPCSTVRADMLAGIRCSLVEAREIYAKVIGFTSRLHWRRRISELEGQLAALERV